MTDHLTDFLQATLVLDTETTSLIHKEAEIIQYASADVLTILSEIAAETKRNHAYKRNSINSNILLLTMRFMIVAYYRHTE